MRVEQDLLKTAIQLHQNGRVKEAIELYQKISVQQGNNPEYFYLLGTAYLQVGRAQDAVSLLNKSLSMNSRHLEACKNLGLALLSAGRLLEALDTFNSLIKLKPGFADAHFNKANTLKQLKKYDEALISYDKAIKINPDYIQAHYNRSNLLLTLRRFDKAVYSYDKVLKLMPNLAEAHNNLGSALKELGRFDEALNAFEKALSINPQFAAAFNNKGATLNALKCFDKALNAFEQAVKLQPGYSEALNNKGVAEKELKRYEAAELSFRQAIECNSEYVAAYINLGNMFKEIKKLDEALSVYDKAIGIQEDNAEAHFYKALVLLMKGDYKHGWPLYQWRHKTDIQGLAFKPKAPLWMPAESNLNKRVLVHGEQGIGDQIMFASMLPELAANTGQLIAHIDPRLIPLFQRSFSEGILYAPNNTKVELKSYDMSISMGDLCQYFRNSENDFVDRAPFLVADATRTEGLRTQLLEQGNNRPICGISWKSKNEKSGDKRSLTLNKMLESLGARNFQFVNLQYGNVGDEVSEAEKALNIRILHCESVDNKDDIDGLAALIQACDLVISIDNTTVHLAGALGQDVRVLLPFSSDWRWLVERSDTPWYPSMKLYRQTIEHDWDGVLSEVLHELEQL